jgi:hypothetical protein
VIGSTLECETPLNVTLLRRMSSLKITLQKANPWPPLNFPKYSDQAVIANLSRYLAESNLDLV